MSKSSSAGSFSHPLHEVIDKAAQPIALLGEDLLHFPNQLVLRYANKAFYHLSGLRPEDMKAHPLCIPAPTSKDPTDSLQVAHSHSTHNDRYTSIVYQLTPLHGKGQMERLFLASCSSQSESQSKPKSIHSFERVLLQLHLFSLQCKEQAYFYQLCLQTCIDVLGLSGIQWVSIDLHKGRIRYHKGYTKTNLVPSRRLSTHPKNLAMQTLKRHTVVHWHLQSGQDKPSDAKWFQSQRIKTVLALPLQYRKTLARVLCCYADEERAFDFEDISFLHALHNLMHAYHTKKQYEDEIFRSESKYQELFHKHPFPLLLYDPHSRHFLDANEAAQTNYGYNSSEFLTLTIYDLFAPSRRAKLEALAKNGKLFLEQIPIDWPHFTKAGKAIHVETFSNPIRYKQRDLVMIQVHNITERVMADRKQRALNKELTARNKELQKFAYITSHNLRAPIVNLSMLFNLLDRDTIRGDWNEQIITRFGMSVKKIEETLSDLIQVVAERKANPRDRRVVDFALLTKETIVLLSEEIKQSGMQISTDFEEVPAAHYIKSHLANVWINLMTNALRYRQKDRKPSLHLWSRKKDSFIMLGFQDNGQGIDLEAHRDKLFGLYQRFHEGSPEGKGIGLHLVQTQLRSLGGRIEVESEVGKGATFKVYIKAKPA